MWVPTLYFGVTNKRLYIKLIRANREEDCNTRGNGALTFRISIIISYKYINLYVYNEPPVYYMVIPLSNLISGMVVYYNNNPNVYNIIHIPTQIPDDTY